jgi:hypothetical protein
MDGIDARHAVGWSIFGLAIIALAGALAANRVLVAGVQTATKNRQSQAVQVISSVRQRTQQWPKNETDPLLTAADRSRVKSARVGFRLDKVDVRARKAFYFVSVGERSVRLDVAE